MSRPTIYLAGPISGKTYDQATDWRRWVTAYLGDDVVVLNPMRFKESMGNFVGRISPIGKDYPDDPLCTGRAIYARDGCDVRRSDCILVNLVGARHISIGTVMEMAWAAQLQKIVVCAMEPGNIHEHLMLNETISIRTHTLQEAVDAVVRVF